MISTLDWSVVDRMFFGYNIGTCCFPAKYMSLQSKKQKTGRLEINLMCPSGEICLPSGCRPVN